MQHDTVTTAEEQEKWLADAMALVQHHAFFMRRALVRLLLHIRSLKESAEYAGDP